MALEDHRAVEARALNGLAVDDHRALARRIKPGEDVEHGGLAAAGMADHAREFAALDRQPEIFENRDVTASGMRISLGNRLDRNEFIDHRIIPGTSPCGGRKQASVRAACRQYR